LPSIILSALVVGFTSIAFAMDYDRLAKLAEEQLADQERGAIGDKT